MSEYGNKEKPVDSESKRNEPLTETLRAGHDVWISGHHIECWDSTNATVITINGRLYRGTYAEAIQHVKTLPTRSSRSEF